MKNTDRYYYARSLGSTRLLPGMACQSLDQALNGHDVADDYEQAIFQAMSDCHSRQMELILNNSGNIMFDPESSNDHLLASLHDGYRSHIQSIIRATMQTNHAENIYGLAINACARYVNIASRIAIANGRKRIPAITLPHSEALTQALEQSDIKTQTTPDEDSVHFINMLQSMLVYTAHYMDPSQIPDSAYTDAAKYAIRTEYGR